MKTAENIIEEIAGFYRIIPLKILRRTPGVSFDFLPQGVIPHIDAVDRVIHERGAVSPDRIGTVERPWYMHPHQDDNLMVLHGERHVDIYTRTHGKIESFAVAPQRITKGDTVIYEGAAMLVWPRGVFHRIRSSEETGSASVNFALHYEGFDIRTNFSIYGLNTDTGDFRIIREGHLDQPGMK